MGMTYAPENTVHVFFFLVGQERRHSITSCMSLVSLIPFTDTATTLTLPVLLGKQRDKFSNIV